MVFNRLSTKFSRNLEIQTLNVHKKDSIIKKLDFSTLLEKNGVIDF